MVHFVGAVGVVVGWVENEGSVDVDLGEGRFLGVSGEGVGCATTAASHAVWRAVGECVTTAKSGFGRTDDGSSVLVLVVWVGDVSACASRGRGSSRGRCGASGVGGGRNGGWRVGRDGIFLDVRREAASRV